MALSDEDKFNKRLIKNLTHNENNIQTNEGINEICKRNFVDEGLEKLSRKSVKGGFWGTSKTKAIKKIQRIFIICWTLAYYMQIMLPTCNAFNLIRYQTVSDLPQAFVPRCGRLEDNRYR